MEVNIACKVYTYLMDRIADMAMLEDDSHTIQEIDNALGNCDIVKLELEKLRTKLK